MTETIWIAGFFGILVAALAAVFVISKRARTNNESVPQAAADVFADVVVQRDKVLEAAKPIAAAGLDQLAKVLSELETKVTQLHDALLTPKTIELGQVYIDRDDLCKHITDDYPDPVLLDDVPIHNGRGDSQATALEYWTWPGKGIHNSKPVGTVTTTGTVTTVAK